MLEAGGLACGAIGPFEVLDEAVRERANVSWWFGERRADVDLEAHLAPKPSRCGVKPIDSETSIDTPEAQRAKGVSSRMGAGAPGGATM